MDPVIAAPLPALTELVARGSAAFPFPAGLHGLALIGHGAESERYGFLRALAEEAELDHVPGGHCADPAASIREPAAASKHWKSGGSGRCHAADRNHQREGREDYWVGTTHATRRR